MNNIMKRIISIIALVAVLLAGPACERHHKKDLPEKHKAGQEH